MAYRKSPTFNEPLVCSNCGKTVKKISATQKYCEECSKIKDKERKGKWYRYKEKPMAGKRSQQKRQRGLQISKLEGEKGRANWLSTVDKNCTKQAIVTIPFSYHLSKNHIWALNEGGHRQQRAEQNEKQSDLSEKIEEAVKDINFTEGKIWLDIFVQKPDHKGDAINLIDRVCDAVKHAIKIDDRWYSIRRLDWQIVKEDGMLMIAISQFHTEHIRVCSLCGRELPLSEFKKNKGNRLGHARECFDCCTNRMIPLT